MQLGDRDFVWRGSLRRVATAQSLNLVVVWRGLLVVGAPFVTCIDEVGVWQDLAVIPVEGPESTWLHQQLIH